MHDIARTVMGKECVTMIDNSSMKKLADPTRHAFLKIPRFVERKFFDELLEKPTLQTLFCEDYNIFFDISKYTSLRALHFPGCTKVGGMLLQHLRYLNLSGNKFLKELPDNVSSMYNLQTLDLSHCYLLRQLPKDMKYMTNLRHLYTTGCTSLTCMPPRLGQITCLQTISYFVVGGSSRCSNIGELRSLNLGGELELSCLENATEALAREANLGNKEKLTHLSLQWDDDGQEEQVQDCHKKVLHSLKPHDDLEMLRINNYKGTSLPLWISNLNLLTEFHLLGCILCEEFPQFCHFKSLQVLFLEKLDKLRSLCSDTSSLTFLALKELRLHDLESLETWVAIEGQELTFPVLEKLDIMNCPKLTTLPKAPNLKFIKLDEDKVLLSSELVKSNQYISSLSKLELSILGTEKPIPPKIDQILESSSLLELKLEGCNFFFSNNPLQPTFGAWKWFEKLVSLGIFYCDGLIYWPEDVFQSLVSLNQLLINCCDKLIGRTPVRGGEPKQTADQVLPHLMAISIEHCASLEELFILPPTIMIMFIEFCPRLESVWGQGEHRETDDVNMLEYLHALVSISLPGQSPSPMIPFPCLYTLRIRGCNNMAILPNLSPTLRILHIICCEKLCSMSGHLDILEELLIEGCSELQSLDSLGGLASLQILYLDSCRCLACLPGVLGNYSALRKLRVKYCPSIDLKPLYKNHRQRLDNLELKYISHAHSSDPSAGSKLREPRSWKYVIPGVAASTSRRHWMYYSD